MYHINRSRRHFLQTSGALALGSTLPISLVELAFADEKQNFTFAYISDAHIQQIKGNRFVRNWDRGLIRAVAEANLLTPKPDFVMFGGDLAQLGSAPELDHGAEILSALKYKTRYVMGEHDYYLDLGAYWEKLFGPQYYSFDHKGVHFIVLNSIRTYDDWTYHRWPTAEQRMLEMAGLDNPNSSPFMVGEEQRQWLKKDLAKIPKTTPIVVFSHSPLQKNLQGLEFLDRGCGADSGAVEAFQQGVGDLRPCASDSIQPNRQYQFQFGDGDRLAVAVSAGLCAGRAIPAEADRADEPLRPVLRARCDWLAVHQCRERSRRSQLPAARKHRPQRWLRQGRQKTGRCSVPVRRRANSAAKPFLICQGNRP